MPMKLPVAAPDAFALRPIVPGADARLAPDDKTMVLPADMAMAPLPVVCRSLLELDNVIVPAFAERSLPEASAIAFVKSIELNLLPLVPTASPALKSGSEFTVIVSAALPLLTVTVPVGFAKSVVSNVAPFSRDRVLLMPSSPSVTVFGPAGRLNVTSAAVPVFVIGARPV